VIFREVLDMPAKERYSSAMANTIIKGSSWIKSYGYANGFLAAFLKNGTAILVADVPAHVPGLLKAARATAKTTGKRLSPGATFWRIVRSQHLPSQAVKDAAEVAYLRSTMEAA
jgi:hypothetical protein